MFSGEQEQWTDGEEQAWYRLTLSAPAEVCRRTGACFDEYSSAYILNVFNTSVAIHPGHREIQGTGDLCNLLLGKLSKYSRLSILWYLLEAQDIPPLGNLINPRDLAGGLIFTRGSHALPLDTLAARYGGDTAAFLRQGMAMGGECSYYGDASITLYPFPRVPVLLVLWRKDEEFQANAVLLLDATCSLHLPPDIIWSTSMVSILVML